jgi:predicted 3-demethylubiquinone-9 3-methyltransferase (glyoxalase superfamily)
MARLETTERTATSGRPTDRQKITTFLAFNDQAEEAIKLYTSVFKNSRIINLTRSETDGPIAKGKVLGAEFELAGQRFMAMDGGPHFQFSDGISLYVDCETQVEVDYYWEKLSAGSSDQGQCGWLKDRFGLSWQIIPSVLTRMLTDSRSGNSQRAMEAMLKMKKIDIATLERAYAQR